MQKMVTARHFDLTPEIRAKAEDEMEGLTRFFDNIISAEFILDMERHRRIAELRVKVYKDVIAATGAAIASASTVDSSMVGNAKTARATAPTTTSSSVPCTTSPTWLGICSERTADEAPTLRSPSSSPASSTPGMVRPPSMATTTPV